MDIVLEVNPPPIPNYPPYFKTALKKLKIQLGETLSYTLPSIGDDNGDLVSISVSDVPSFASYSNPTFDFSPLSDLDRGLFQIKIELNDGTISVFYSLDVTVWAPVYVDPVVVDVSKPKNV